MLRAFGHRVVTCCEVLDVVGSDLTIFKLEPTTPNMSQHGGQTHATCCAQQCCDMLCWHVAIVWLGLNKRWHLLLQDMLGPNYLIIDHLGQVCVLCTIFYQAWHTALNCCAVLIISRVKQNVKMSYCDIIFDDVTKTWFWYTSFLISNYQLNISLKRACLGDYNTENRSSPWHISWVILYMWQFKEISLSPQNLSVHLKSNPLIFFLHFSFIHVQYCTV